MSEIAINMKDLSIYYGDFEAVKSVTMAVPSKSITALIGPSGCGKSTLLRTLNRMNDRIADFSVEGELDIDGENIYAPGVNLIDLRKRSAWCFKVPIPCQCRLSTILPGPLSTTACGAVGTEWRLLWKV